MKCKKIKFRVTLNIASIEGNEQFCEAFKTYAKDYADAEERAIDWAYCKYSKMFYEITIKSSYIEEGGYYGSI